ncbi:hypothetical protein CCOS865_03167 [Pseudomonas reidholzensis]|uniref:DUF4398 domain-containing protein n=1 Tax=Pseudomonas reidholzensis TaxID=1785162 RepID=A0A383RV22_9PSED|nr:DUF4398 domain-containing protein [Pseudomonas reidholzensis]SYX90899.1 hypothetical protein CCOS865_03167 [Pseudomonas reidholzensis]
MRARFNPKVLPVAGLLVVLSGCANVIMPNEQIELTRNAVNRAVSADATHYAPVEMRAAQDKLSAMDRALGHLDVNTVRTLAEQSEADARLAERKALASKTQEQLEDAQKGIEVLKQELLDAPSETSVL